MIPEASPIGPEIIIMMIIMFILFRTARAMKGGLCLHHVQYKITIIGSSIIESGIIGSGPMVSMCRVCRPAISPSRHSGTAKTTPKDKVILNRKFSSNSIMNASGLG